MSRYRPAHVSTEEIEKFMDRINEVPEFAKAPKISVTPAWANQGFASERDAFLYKVRRQYNESTCPHCNEKIFYRKSDVKFDKEQQRNVAGILENIDYPIELPISDNNPRDIYGNIGDDRYKHKLHWCDQDSNISIDKKLDAIFDNQRKMAEALKKLMHSHIKLLSIAEKKKFWYTQSALYE